MKEVYHICFSEFLDKFDKNFPGLTISGIDAPTAFCPPYAYVSFDVNEKMAKAMNFKLFDDEKDFLKRHPMEVEMTVRGRDPRLPFRFYPWEREEQWGALHARISPRDLISVSLKEKENLNSEEHNLFLCVEDELPYRLVPVLKDITNILNRAFRFE